MPFIEVQVTTADLGTEDEISWETVERFLSPFSLRQIVDTAARISLSLSFAEADSNALVAQRRVADGVGVKFDEMLEKAAAAHPEMQRHQLRFFHERSVLTLLKFAANTVPADRPDGTEPLGYIAAALLVINGLTDPDLKANIADPTERRRRLARYMFANGHFNRGTTLLSEMTRSYLLFVEEAVHLREHPQYVALRERLERATGLPPERVWQALFAFLTYYRSLTPAGVDSADRFIDATRFFEESEVIRGKDVERTFALTTTRLVDLRERLRDTYDTHHLQSFDMSAFARTPLVEFAPNQVACLSLPRLAEALGMGLQHRYLDRQFSAQEREEFLAYRGVLIEDYVSALLRRMFAGTGRLVDATTLADSRRTGGGKSCDAAVIYHDSVILFEVKGNLGSLKATTDREGEAFSGLLDDTYFEGMRQIIATVERIEAGRYRDVGLDPENLRQYIPVIVTLELGLDPVSHAVVTGELSDGGLRHPKMREMQSLEVAELEQLETGVAAGANLRDLFLHKLSDPALAAMPMRNFIFMLGPSWREQHNAYLATAWERISQEASLALLSRSAERANEELTDGEHASSS